MNALSTDVVSWDTTTDGAPLSAFHSRVDTLRSFHNAMVPSLILQVYLLLFEFPLLALYLYGPYANGWLFWGGKELSEICALLTGVSVEHWRRNGDVCQNLIYSRFNSFVLLFAVACYVCILCAVAYRCCCCGCDALCVGNKCNYLLRCCNHRRPTTSQQTASDISTTKTLPS